jgi:hypothetical protein
MLQQLVHTVTTALSTVNHKISLQGVINYDHLQISPDTCINEINGMAQIEKVFV